MASENGGRPAGVLTYQERMLGTAGRSLVTLWNTTQRSSCGLPPETPGRQHGQNGGVAAAESSSSGLMNRA